MRNSKMFLNEVYFWTNTVKDWKHLLKPDKYKQLILDTWKNLVEKEQIAVYAFVIMPNHLHMIWQMLGEHRREDVQRDFLKFTSQQILKHLRNEQAILQKRLVVDAKDRRHQVWKRNSLSIPLWSDWVFTQKLDYIHNNPVKAGLCKNPEDYHYSSARFYRLNDRHWDFLTHYNG